jgi:hypothetical protein
MKMPRRQGDDDNVATKVIAGHVPGESDRLMLIYSALEDYDAVLENNQRAVFHVKA